MIGWSRAIDRYRLPMKEPDAIHLHRDICRQLSPRESAIVDALHIASAAVSRVDYLLTWNCSHIANPMILPRVFRALDDFGLPFPVICTPQDMLEEYGDDPTN